ncbi:glycosyltransferase [Micromonospora zhanjiangensis]|uniref:Glycosyltransferase n=1 Tax=Micromonospora zhanjiangensis TaxID=1522057 RepID=A0ABV8KIM3_9ACTN
MCAAFEPGFRAGGPIRSMVGLLEAISDRVDLSLVTRDRDIGSSEPYPVRSGQWIKRGRSRVFYLDGGSLRQWLRLWRELRSTPFDVLYVNSLLGLPFSILPVLAVRCGLLRVRRVLLAPRGELDRGALRIKAGKKRLFLRCYRPVLRGVDLVWHASSTREADDVRRWLPTARIMVVPNNTALPREPLPAVPPEDGPARLVFISRVHPKKNLQLIITALAAVSIPVTFDIYGPLEDAAYWAGCQRSCRELPPQVRVRYRGEVPLSQVRDTFARYDAFVFPTFGENFGHVIPEALSSSCPVICSAETPWSEVITSGGGAVLTESTPAALAREIVRVAGRNATDRLRAKQAAGAAYARWRAEPRNNANVLDEFRTAADPVSATGVVRP